MDVSSWFRRNFVSNSNTTATEISEQKPRTNGQQHDDQILGVTDQLIELVKSFSFDTFKNFPLSDSEETKCSDDSPTTSGNVRNDLSDWQQRHASLVLSKVKELSQIRYKLCPGYLKEHQFWMIYFALVKSHVAQYELQAIRLAKLKEMALENGKFTDKNACEVEMAETKNSANLPPQSP